MHHLHVLPELVQQHAEGIRGLEVVLDDQETRAAKLPRAIGASGLGSRRGRWKRRELDRERGPAALALAPNAHAPAVQLGDALHDREPDPEPADRSIERLLALREEIEDAWRELARDAGAVVVDP